MAKLRNALKPDHLKSNQDTIEYAPEYTRQEKIRIVIKHMAWALPLVLILKYYAMPLLNDYTDGVQCYFGGKVTNHHLVFYGAFTVMPFFFIMMLLTQVKRHYRIIKLGQNPLPHEKVMKPTAYQYGVRARLKPIAFFIMLGVLIGITIYATFQIQQFLSDNAPRVQELCNFGADI